MIDTKSKKARKIFYNSTDWKEMRNYILARDNYE